MAEENGVTKRNARTCACESCKRGRGVPHKITPKEINGYTSMPSEGWRPYMTLAEKRDVEAGAPKPWYMGVELETQLPVVNINRIPGVQPLPPEPRGIPYYEARYADWEAEYRRISRANRDVVDSYMYSGANQVVSGEQVVSMARPRQLWHAKHDGSVTGPEFASKPASLAWWYSRRAQFEHMFTTALHAGVRSHSGDKCGMHVNISMTAFENAAHLARFAKLINLNRSWSRKMSQRTEGSLHWAAIGGYGFQSAGQIDRWAEKTVLYGYGDHDRYNALNTPGAGRIEFRLPRGTLRLDRFFKNLEWTHSMVEYTRAFGDTSAAAYMRWVMSGTNYPNLQAFLTERFGVGIVDVPFSPVAAPVAVGSMAAVSSPNVLAEYVARDPNTLYLDRNGRPRARPCPCGDGCPEFDCGNCGTDGPDGDPDDYTDDDACACGDGCQVGDCGNCEEDEQRRIDEENLLEQERLLNDMSTVPEWIAPATPMARYAAQRSVPYATGGTFDDARLRDQQAAGSGCRCEICIELRHSIAEDEARYASGLTRGTAAESE